MARDGNIYRRVGDHWEQVDGALVQLSVSANGKWVVGVNAGGNIYRRPTDLSHPWEQLPGALAFISTYDGNLMWGVNK